jgi:uncharacterized protein YdiU (UPF0061 family)
MLDAVVAAQAELVARWLLVGFIHGVMNTDNMAVSGETIDYGPCAFMDQYDPATVFSSIDRLGRYAYGNQPQIALWNLTRLGEAMLPLLADDTDAAVEDAQDALAAFGLRFERAYHGGLRAKLGLATAREEDVELAGEILVGMAENQVDFTNFFRRLSDAGREPGNDELIRSLFVDPTRCDALLARWRERLAQERASDAERRAAMRAVNPAFIPRNHRVEEMIAAAVERDDFGPFEEMLAVLCRPYDNQPEHARYAEPPEPHERVLATFCGT